jgi:signal transduction histidine kinase
MNNVDVLATGPHSNALRASSARLDQAGRLERAVLRDIVGQLQDRERLRAEWTAIVVHELRRPLTMIDLSAQLLQETTPAHGPEVQHRLEQIRRAVEELSRLTNDLLDASCIDARAMRVEPVPVQIAELAQDAIAHCPDLAERCLLRAEPGARLLALADPHRIEQVLGNLLENAVKYGDSEARIEVDIGAHEQGVRVTVSSRGPGIPASRLSRVFDRFERSPQSGLKKPGLGLGLFIAKGLVEAHGGRIWANSAWRDHAVSFHPPTRARAIRT